MKILAYWAICGAIAFCIVSFYLWREDADFRIEKADILPFVIYLLLGPLVLIIHGCRIYQKHACKKRRWTDK